MRYVLIAAVLFALGCSNPDNGDANNGSNDPNNTSSNNANNDGSNNANNDGSNNGPANNSNNETADMGVDMPVLDSPCPGSIPAADTACDQEGLQCEYGDDPRAQCRNVATCDDDVWRIDERFCDPLPDVVCPMTRDDASGMDCDAMDAYCTFGDLVCHCTNCVTGPVEMCGGDPTWMCDIPNPDPECPDGKPRLGSGCDVDGKLCEYACGTGGARVCRTGSWNAAEGGPCPMSTSRVKRDIRYLSADELETISKALQSIPLAHYEYTDPSIGKGEKLGFIIEDLPAATPAVDRQRMMVDLYGYTSMLVADAQAREKRMKALEARLTELEAKTKACE